MSTPAYDPAIEQLAEKMCRELIGHTPPAAVLCATRVLAAFQSERDEEFARLREELGRAAVEVGVHREALFRLVHAIEVLASETTGVDGLHLNGDLAPWESLLPGGEYEQWLSCLGLAEQVLSDPIPLADAGWEVLEAAMKLRNERATPYESPEQWERHEDRLAEFLELFDHAVDRFRALLEGRGGEED